MIKNILLVGLGGGIGSMARYLCQKWFADTFQHPIPWGCFAIGIFWGLSFKSFAANEYWKLLLMTGLCGGFTTFSAFTLEGIGLIKEQRLALFFSYVAASMVLGLLATFIGMKITR